MSRRRKSISHLMANHELSLEKVKECAKSLGIRVRSERSGLTMKEYRTLEAVVKKERVEPTPQIEVDGVTIPEDPSEPEWPMIGSAAEVTYLSSSDVLAIHDQLVLFFVKEEDPIDPPGPRDIALLDSAVDRPLTSLGSIRKYPSVTMAGAALFHSIIHNHPFHNGNKRTAMVSLLEYLRRNGIQLDTSVKKEQLYTFALSVASHQIKVSDEWWSESDSEVLGIAQWLQSNTRRTQKGEKTLSFGQLQVILRKFGCEVKRSTGNRVEIRRDKRVSKITSAGDGRECDKGTISKVRKELELDELHGFDSITFYEGGNPVQEFIMEYRELLSDLAKT